MSTLCWSHNSLVLLFPEALTTKSQSLFCIMITTQFILEELFLSSKLLLFNRYSCLFRPCCVSGKQYSKQARAHTYTHFYMTTSALWDKQAHRWSGVTPAGRLPGCGVLPCCDSILSVPVCVLSLSLSISGFREIHSKHELHILHTQVVIKVYLSHTHPAAGLCTQTFRSCVCSEGCS